MLRITTAIRTVTASWTLSGIEERQPMRQKSALGLLALLITAVSVGVTTSPASAAVIPTSFDNYASPGCLDASDNGSSIYMHVCNGGDNQTWIWNSEHGVRTPIRHNKSGRCLEASGATVKLAACNTSALAQRWVLEPYPGVPFIRMGYGNRTCLRDTNGRLQLVTCQNGDGFQRWFAQ